MSTDSKKLIQYRSTRPSSLMFTKIRKYSIKSGCRCDESYVHLRSHTHKKIWKPTRCKVCHFRSCVCFNEIDEDIYFSSQNNKAHDINSLNEKITTCFHSIKNCSAARIIFHGWMILLNLIQILFYIISKIYG